MHDCSYVLEHLPNPLHQRMKIKPLGSNINISCRLTAFISERILIHHSGYESSNVRCFDVMQCFVIGTIQKESKVYALEWHFDLVICLKSVHDFATKIARIIAYH